jgi:hypothetical protein
MSRSLFAFSLVFPKNITDVIIPLVRSRLLFTLLLTGSITLLSELVFPRASVAQVGVGATITPINPNLSTTPAYELQTNVSCPTPSFNVNGFAADAHADAFSQEKSSSNGYLGSYGVSVGFSVPIGGALSQFCEDYAASKTAFEKSRTTNQLLNSQFSLLHDLEDKAFLPDGPLSSFAACRELASLLSDPKRRPNSPPITNQPEKASTTPMTPDSQNVNITNPR